MNKLFEGIYKPVTDISAPAAEKCKTIIHADVDIEKFKKQKHLNMLRVIIGLFLSIVSMLFLWASRMSVIDNTAQYLIFEIPYFNYYIVGVDVHSIFYYIFGIIADISACLIFWSLVENKEIKWFYIVKMQFNVLSWLWMLLIHSVIGNIVFLLPMLFLLIWSICKDGPHRLKIPVIICAAIILQYSIASATMMYFNITVYGFFIVSALLFESILPIMGFEYLAQSIFQDTDRAKKIKGREKKNKYISRIKKFLAKYISITIAIIIIILSISIPISKIGVSKTNTSFSKAQDLIIDGNHKTVKSDKTGIENYRDGLFYKFKVIESDFYSINISIEPTKQNCNPYFVMTLYDSQYKEKVMYSQASDVFDAKSENTVYKLDAGEYYIKVDASENSIGIGNTGGHLLGFDIGVKTLRT